MIDQGGAAPAMESDNSSSIAEATVLFDAIELHPMELELQDEEDGETSEGSDEGETVAKRRGRRKGSKNKASPEVTRKLGDATLHYAYGRIEEAICVLNEVIRLAPNLSDAYQTLALVYTALNDTKKALNYYMIAAHLSPKDASLRKLLVARSIMHGDKRQANYCLNKAIIADPEEIDLRFHCASLYVEVGEYQKAADTYEQISRLCPDGIDVIKLLQKATKLYQRCGQHERAVDIVRHSLQLDTLSVETTEEFRTLGS